MNTTNLYWDSNMSDNLSTPDPRDTSFANPDHVLVDSGYRDAETKELKIGKMPVNPDLNITMSVSDQYKIPLGYHSGKTLINVLGIADSTIGTATEHDIAFNKVAWVNGIRIVGKLNINKNDMTANCTEDDILYNKTAWVNGSLVTGKISIIMRDDKELFAGDNYTIPKGYHGGEGVIGTKSLASQTVGTATIDDIVKGKVAWVNGKLLVGEAKTLLETLEDSTAKAKDIRKGLIAYISSGKAIGGMDEYIKRPLKKLICGSSYTIPEGYHDGLWVIQAESLTSQTDATAVANDIRKGTTAWVRGIKINGTMIQNIAPNTDATAVANDIRSGKTAWVNGDKVIGKNPYNTINFNAKIKNNTYVSSPIVITLPSHNWDLIRCINIQVCSTTNDSDLYDFYYEDYKSDDIIIEDNGGNIPLLSIVSSMGSPKITIISLVPNTYLKVFVSGYTILE